MVHEHDEQSFQGHTCSPPCRQARPAIKLTPSPLRHSTLLHGPVQGWPSGRCSPSRPFRSFCQSPHPSRACLQGARVLIRYDLRSTLLAVVLPLLTLITVFAVAAQSVGAWLTATHGAECAYPLGCPTIACTSCCLPRPIQSAPLCHALLPRDPIPILATVLELRCGPLAQPFAPLARPPDHP